MERNYALWPYNRFLALYFINFRIEKPDHPKIGLIIDFFWPHLRPYVRYALYLLQMLFTTHQVKRFFHRVAGDVADFDSPFDAISQLSELLKQDDSDWLALDIGTLVKKYPDVSQEQGGIKRLHGPR